MDSIVYLLAVALMIALLSSPILIAIFIFRWIKSAKEKRREESAIWLENYKERGEHWAATALARAERSRLEAVRAESAAREAELAKLRDADIQDEPFRYKVDRHALETLAIRYGIPHVHADGSEKESILVRKISPSANPDRFRAVLPDYRNREVDVIIEKGTGYVKTFLPINDQEWYPKNREIEKVLKGNKGFTIKEIATMHVHRLNTRR